MAVVYGPNFFTAGAFSQVAPASSLPGYPPVVYVENTETVDVGGPNGARFITAVAGDFAIGALTIANFGPINGGYWSILGDADGPGYYYGIWANFSAAAEAATGGDNYAFTFGSRRTSPSEGYHESFALRVGDGGLHIRENGVETTVGAIQHDNLWHYILIYINGSSDGGFAADGIIRVSLDGPQIFEKTNSTLYVDAWPSDPQDFVSANYVNFGRYGMLPTTGFTIYSTPLDSTRNLLTGDTHAVQGNDNLIAGAFGTLIGERSVLLNLDGVARTEIENGALIVNGRFIHNGAELSSGVGDLSAALDALGAVV